MRACVWYVCINIYMCVYGVYVYIYMCVCICIPSTYKCVCMYVSHCICVTLCMCHTAYVSHCVCVTLRMCHTVHVSHCVCGRMCAQPRAAYLHAWWLPSASHSDIRTDAPQICPSSYAWRFQLYAALTGCFVDLCVFECVCVCVHAMHIRERQRTRK